MLSDPIIADAHIRNRYILNVNVILLSMNTFLPIW